MWPFLLSKVTSEKEEVSSLYYLMHIILISELQKKGRLKCHTVTFLDFHISCSLIWMCVNPFSFRMSFLTSVLLTNHDLMFSVIIYPFNALKYSLRFMCHTVTINIFHLCVEKNTSQVVFRILIEYVEMTMSWYDDMIWWWYWLSYQRKSINIIWEPSKGLSSQSFTM